jgi:hypothetical protein
MKKSNIGVLLLLIAVIIGTLLWEVGQGDCRMEMDF